MDLHGFFQVVLFRYMPAALCAAAAAARAQPPVSMPGAVFVDGLAAWRVMVVSNNEISFCVMSSPAAFSNPTSASTATFVGV